MKKNLLITILFALVFLFSACTSNNNSNNELSQIVTTFMPVEEITKNIVGNTSSVSVLIPSNADPHSFEPSSTQLIRFTKADIFVTMGGMFENIEKKLMDLNSNLIIIDSTHNIHYLEAHEHENEHEHINHLELIYHEDENKIEYSMEISMPTPCYNIYEEFSYEEDILVLNLFLQDKTDSQFACAQVITIREHGGEINLEQEVHEFKILYNGKLVLEKHLDEMEHEHDAHGHEHGEFDPHIWLSIDNMILMSQEISTKLSEIYPQNSEIYQENTLKYIEKLNILKSEFDEKLSNCQKDKIIVNHKAFGYLAHEYNFEQISVAGFSPEVQASPKAIQEVIEIAKEYNLKYVFSEGQLDPKTAQTIANDIGGEVLELNPVESNNAEDYFGIMRKNLMNLAIGLECE